MNCKIDHDGDDLWIPRFLCAVCNPRKIGSNGGPMLVAEWIDPVAERQRELRAQWAEADKLKRKAALAAHLEKHAGERWAAPKGTKTKMWIRDDKSLDAHHAKLQAEFEAECAAAELEEAA